MSDFQSASTLEDILQLTHTLESSQRIELGQALLGQSGLSVVVENRRFGEFTADQIQSIDDDQLADLIREAAQRLEKQKTEANT